MTIPRRAFVVGGAAAVAAACSAAAKRRPSAPASSYAASPPAGPASSPAPTTTLPSPGGPAAFVAHGPATSTGVALTFHTAGDPAITQRLLDSAASNGAKLTFFVVGTWLSSNPGMAASIQAGGHDFGNHTWSHINLPSLPPAAMFSEIERCATELHQATGSISRWFRPSQTDVPDAAILEQAGKAGYPTSVGYDVDPLDYTNPGSALVLSRTRARLHPGAIVSLHTLYSGTADTFDAIVAAIHARGLQPVALSTLLA